VKTSKNFSVAAFVAASVWVLAGCTVGPNYRRANAPEAAHWDVAEPWRESAPKDALGKGEWWAIFKDDELNALEKEALSSNQTLKIPWRG
jgi:outer membrane protein TolC